MAGQPIPPQKFSLTYPPPPSEILKFFVSLKIRPYIKPRNPQTAFITCVQVWWMVVWRPYAAWVMSGRWSTSPVWMTDFNRTDFQTFVSRHKKRHFFMSWRSWANHKDLSQNHPKRWVKEIPIRHCYNLNKISWDFFWGMEQPVVLCVGKQLNSCT